MYHYDIRSGSAIIFTTNGDVVRTFEIDSFESYNDMQAKCLAEWPKLVDSVI